MANDLTTTQSTDLANLSEDIFKKALATEVTFSGQFLEFDGNTGDYLYGPGNEKKELAHGSRLAVDMVHFRKGWICWKNSKVVDEVMQTIIENPAGPSKDELADHSPYDTSGELKDGWTAQRSFDMIFGETGEIFLFKTMSGGGRRGARDLLEAFVKSYKLHPGMLPIVEIGASKFDVKNDKGKKVGTKFAPKFTVVDWLLQTTYLEMKDAALSGDTNDDDDGEDDAGNYETEQQQEQVSPPPSPPPPPPPAETVAPADAPKPTGRRSKAF